MVLGGPKVKRLNKEMVTQVLLDNFDFSPELICEIVECIWRSGDAAEQGVQADGLYHGDVVNGSDKVVYGVDKTTAVTARR